MKVRQVLIENYNKISHTTYASEPWTCRVKISVLAIKNIKVLENNSADREEKLLVDQQVDLHYNWNNQKN